MTPQLQQAIKLLQLSALDLEQEIADRITENPMLELDEDEPSSRDSESDNNFDDATSRSELPDAPVDAERSEIPEDLPVDSNWDDVYQNTGGSMAGGAGESWDNDNRSVYEESLTDHLLWQLNLTPFSTTDHAIASALIDAIDADGMLTINLEELTAAFNEEDPDVEIEEVLAVLKRIQQFDPIGVGARSLSECLALQLAALPQDTPSRDDALIVVNDHLNLLAAHDYNGLSRATKLPTEQLAEVVALIQTLNPRPGSAIGGPPPEYVVPEILVRKATVAGTTRWVVELNNDAVPRVRLNQQYADLAKVASNSKDSEYIRDTLAEARWFIKSLQSRNETLLKVASKIVEVQRGFLEYGEEAMKPLVLADIAEAVEMHESTISRVTSRKYMHTPRGVFELKYFFSSHVGTNTGGEVSSTAIRALIKKLVAEEEAKKPLSDSKLAAILAQQNIKVARRTVAKYRESMNIPPSNERKRIN